MMKSFFVILFATIVSSGVFSQTLEFEYRFASPLIVTHHQSQQIIFGNTRQWGAPGEPLLPYMAVSLLLPPGEEAVSVEITGEFDTPLPLTSPLSVAQYESPYSHPGSTVLQQKNEVGMQSEWPVEQGQHFTTQYLNGFSFLLMRITPVHGNPQSNEWSYYKSLKIKVHTQKTEGSATALKHLTASNHALLRVRSFAQNPAMMDQYPIKTKNDTSRLLIITAPSLVSGFSALVNYYTQAGVLCDVVSTTTVYSQASGSDQQEKIRNFIIDRYQNDGLDYVILGGDVHLVPYRGFYCYAVSGSGYEDSGIPADLYYSAFDGDFNADGDGLFGEANDDNADLLPEIAIGRFPVNTLEELGNMVNKSLSYQSQPVMADMNRHLFLGELLTDAPLTMGQDYLKLLWGNHADSGYATYGIPTMGNTLDTLYDEWVNPPGYNVEWDLNDLIASVNAGSSFIHHVGHSSETYMMRMSDFDLNSSTFSQLNGSAHSYGLLYTHGCLCGSFDFDDCIAEKAVVLENFLVSGIFNSRYGWFNEGQAEGPSAHLHREFVSAIYDPALNMRNLGDAFVMSKIETAPWVDLPGEYEFGAQRWVHYDNNILGDPLLRIWVDAVETQINPIPDNQFRVFPNPGNGLLSTDQDFTGAELVVCNAFGEIVHSQKVETCPIDVSFLQSGLYVIQISHNQNTWIAKIVIY